MLFADAVLAGRIESAECRFCREVVEAVRARGGDEAFAIPFGGGAALFAGPGSPFNKVIGLGFDPPITHPEAEEVERALGRRGTAVRVEVATLADASVGALLTARGYTLTGFEHVLGFAIRPDAPAAIPAPSLSLTIERVVADETPLWISVVAAGFEHPEATWSPAHESIGDAMLRQTFDDMARSPGSRRYLARWNGEPAGGGHMRVDGGIAQLSGASTLAPFRRRGVQTALLQARLADAAREGCDLAVVTTDPGSRSHQNTQRQGFELLYARAVLVKHPAVDVGVRPGV